MRLPVERFFISLFEQIKNQTATSGKATLSGEKPNRGHKKGREPGKAFDLVLPSPLQEIRKVAGQSYSLTEGRHKPQ